MTKKEMERLRAGQIIQSKKDNKWAFIVHQNFGDRITAVRSIEIRDPEEWEVVDYTSENPVVKKLKDILGTADSQSITAISNELYRKYKDESWFHSIGVTPPTNDKIIIYLQKKKGHPDFDNYKGFKIEWKYVGKIVPL